MKFKIFRKYLWYVVKHKWFVFLECAKRGIVLQGILHDWHKFLPSEFIPYMNYFSGKIKRGRNKTGYYKPTDTGDPAFDHAWFLHQKRSFHHWQSFCFPDEDGTIIIKKMPLKYRKEMLADWLGAGKAQGTPDTAAWYLSNGHKLHVDDETRQWIEKELGLNVVNFKKAAEA
jgi:hypothetical protein